MALRVAKSPCLHYLVERPTRKSTSIQRLSAGAFEVPPVR